MKVFFLKHMGVCITLYLPRNIWRYISEIGLILVYSRKGHGKWMNLTFALFAFWTINFKKSPYQKGRCGKLDSSHKRVQKLEKKN